MSLPALIGFAGVLVAAVATGLLAGRAVRQPRIGCIVWTAATLALTVALAAQSVGFASGFGPVTFRAVELFGLLLAPLWLAWGLAELTWPREAARFGVRLACGALTVVGSVILTTDPLTAGPFGKDWPLPGPHYQAPSHYALAWAQAVAVTLAVASLGLAAVQARDDQRWPGALPGTAAVALAVVMVVAMRLSLPALSLYPLLSMAAAALAWFGATRLEAPPGRVGRPGRRGRAARDRAASESATTVVRGHEPDRRKCQDAANGDRGPAGSPVPHPAQPAARAAPAARPYGRILIFTLLEDRVADFDRLADQAAEEVRTREPDTLVYVIHLVPNAPMQRIFYEIYRDLTAFDRHENQPYMKRFEADRRPCVLATNVIELRLKYAKVAPLPGPPPRPPVPQAVQSQAPEPLPPERGVRPERGMQPERGMPSAARRHGGI
jgi:quinol monooxygenase YgiN